MLEDIENIFTDVGGYDMSFEKYKELCRKSWEEDYIYLCIDKSKKRDQGRYCIFNVKQKHMYRMYSSGEGFLIVTIVVFN